MAGGDTGFVEGGVELMPRIRAKVALWLYSCHGHVKCQNNHQRYFFFPFVIGSWELRRAGDTDRLFFGGLLFAEPISTPHQRPLQPPSLQPFCCTRPEC